MSFLPLLYANDGNTTNTKSNNIMDKVYVDAARKNLKGLAPKELKHPLEVYKALGGDYTSLDLTLSEVLNYNSKVGLLRLYDPEQVKKLSAKELADVLAEVSALEKKCKYIRDVTKRIFYKVCENMKRDGIRDALEVYFSEVGLPPLVDTRMTFSERFALLDDDKKDVRCELEFLSKGRGLSVGVNLTYTAEGIQHINYLSCAYNPLTDGIEHIRQRNAVLGWLSTPKGISTFELFLAALMGEYAMVDKHLEGLNDTLKGVKYLRGGLEGK